MTAQKLHQELQALIAYKKERERIGIAAIRHHLLPELIQLCHHTSNVSHQACWCLEQSVLKDLDCIYPHLNELSKLYTMPINHSGMRSLCKIATILCKHYYSKPQHPIKKLLSTTYKERIIDGCFNQLISSKKAANLAFSTIALYDLGKEHAWIYEQLIPLLEQKLDQNYPIAFKNTALKTLKKLGH